MKALATYPEKCTGCVLCELICALTHFQENNPKKSAIRIKRKFPEPGTFEIQLCRQCGKCKEVCPNEAISEKGGTFFLEPNKCNFCGLCLQECPLGVLFTHQELNHPIKCDLCGECVAVCAAEAIVWR